MDIEEGAWALRRLAASWPPLNAIGEKTYIIIIIIIIIIESVSTTVQSKFKPGKLLSPDLQWELPVWKKVILFLSDFIQTAEEIMKS